MEVGQQMMNRDPFGRLDLSLAQNNEYFTIGHTEATTVTIRPFRPFKTSQEPHGKGQKSRPALLFLHIELYLKVSRRKTTFFFFVPKVAVAPVLKKLYILYSKTLLNINTLEKQMYLELIH